jgi:hypothetical protein
VIYCVPWLRTNCMSNPSHHIFPQSNRTPLGTLVLLTFHHAIEIVK